MVYADSPSECKVTSKIPIRQTRLISSTGVVWVNSCNNRLQTGFLSV